MYNNSNTTRTLNMHTCQHHCTIRKGKRLGTADRPSFGRSPSSRLRCCALRSRRTRPAIPRTDLCVPAISGAVRLPTSALRDLRLWRPVAMAEASRRPPSPWLDELAVVLPDLAGVLSLLRSGASPTSRTRPGPPPPSPHLPVPPRLRPWPPRP